MTILAGKGYNQIRVGDRFSDQRTLTEAHLVMSTGLFGDFAPVHVSETFARGTRFKGRIFHGYFTSGLMAAAVGTFFNGTAVAYLEHSCRFTAPVKPGDTVTITWTISAMEDKPHHGGGIARLSGECRNDQGSVVAEAQAAILVQNVNMG